MSARRVVASLFKLLIGSAIGCNPAPQSAIPSSASHSAAAQPATSNPTASAPIAQLHDWVAAPRVDAAELAPCSMRIVSAAPAATEICCALGLRENLVGRTAYCDYPPGISSVPSIGTLLDVSVELLAQLKPDVVFYSGTSRAQVERLAPLHLHLESLPDDTLQDVFRSIRRVGEVVKRPRTAEALCAAINRELDAVTQARGHAAPRRVLLAIEPLSNPPRALHAAAAGSFLDDLIRRAGHANVVTDRSAPFLPLSLETIARLNPEVIVELAPNEADTARSAADALEAWSRIGALRAVQSKQVRVMRGGNWFLPGPRIALTYRELCRTIDGANASAGE